MDILLHGDSNVNAPIFMTGSSPEDKAAVLLLKWKEKKANI